MQYQYDDLEPGAILWHYKYGDVRIICVATYTKNDSELVVFEVLESNRIYASKVDKFLKPNNQPVVFSTPAQIRDAEQERETVRSKAKTETVPFPARNVNRLETSKILMEFLDVDDMEGKFRVVHDNQDFLDDHLINQMAASLDVIIEDGDLFDRIRELKNCIRTKAQYEIIRR